MNSIRTADYPANKVKFGFDISNGWCIFIVYGVYNDLKVALYIGSLKISTLRHLWALLSNTCTCIKKSLSGPSC